MQGGKVRDSGELWTGEDNWILDARADVTEPSLMDGRSWVLRRPENQPMRRSSVDEEVERRLLSVGVSSWPEAE